MPHDPVSDPSAPAPRAGPAIDAGKVDHDIAWAEFTFRDPKHFAVRLARHCRDLLAAWRAAEESKDKLIDYLVYPIPDADHPVEWAAGCGRAWRSVGFSQGYPDRASAVAAVRKAAGLGLAPREED